MRRIALVCAWMMHEAILLMSKPDDRQHGCIMERKLIEEYDFAPSAALPSISGHFGPEYEQIISGQVSVSSDLNPPHLVST